MRSVEIGISLFKCFSIDLLAIYHCACNKRKSFHIFCCVLTFARMIKAMLIIIYYFDNYSIYCYAFGVFCIYYKFFTVSNVLFLLYFYFRYDLKRIYFATYEAFFRH